MFTFTNLTIKAARCRRTNKARAERTLAPTGKLSRTVKVFETHGDEGEYSVKANEMQPGVYSVILQQYGVIVASKRMVIIK